MKEGNNQLHVEDCSLNEKVQLSENSLYILIFPHFPIDKWKLHHKLSWLIGPAFWLPLIETQLFIKFMNSFHVFPDKQLSHQQCPMKLLLFK